MSKPTLEQIVSTLLTVAEGVQWIDAGGVKEAAYARLRERDLAAENEMLKARIAYYEGTAENPLEATLMAGVGHRFNPDGICIRCGEDAEEWDAGCVEEIIQRYEQRITTLEQRLADQKPQRAAAEEAGENATRNE